MDFENSKKIEITAIPDLDIPSVGDQKLLKRKKEKQFVKTFSSLRNRNYRLLWIGGVLSHIGDDMQLVAVSWLVLILTNSAFLLGVLVGAFVAFCVLLCLDPIRFRLMLMKCQQDVGLRLLNFLIGGDSDGRQEEEF